LKISAPVAAALLAALGLVSALPHARATAPPQSTGSAAWTDLAGDFFDSVYFKFAPSAGTTAGFHQYDTQLEDYSHESVLKQIAALHAMEKRVEAFDASTLNPVEAADRELVLSSIRGTLLTLETIRPWQKDPDIYSSGISESVFGIMSRKFASPDARLASVVAREKQMPAVFAAARANLKNPPHIYTEIAIQQLPDIISFFQKDVPSAFDRAADPAVKAEFAKSNAIVIADLRSYQKWLELEVLPNSKGDFRIGADTFSKKLLYDEMVDTSLDRLLEIGMANLRQNQTEFIRVAKEIDPSKPPMVVLAELEKDHPAPDQLLQSFRDTFNSLIGFIQQKQIITIPSQVRPILEESPPFMRAITTASMDTPGPFEKVATEAYFNVTLPGPHDTPAEIAGRMESFNRGTIVSTAVHEAYPGHYVQFLWMAQAPTKVRKLLGSATNAEGWAHYCEQMMLDEGYNQVGVGAKDERDSKMLRLGQLQDALLRNARFIVGIKMHTGRMTFDEGVKFFETEGYQTHKSGLIETMRGTSDPTYLYYTLGKLQILKLRADVQKKQGSSFSLQQFHNDFMKQGFPPIKIVRQAMLGDNSPTL
jgi:Bacterial protein of unknown function (DUF885)